MGKNVPRKNTVVIKIIDFKRDWIAAVPDKYERDIALQKQDSSWAKFSAYASATNLINNRVNMSIENYFKFIAASGFDPDKYEDKEANPADYIKRNRTKSEKSTKAKDTSKGTYAISTDTSKGMYAIYKGQATSVVKMDAPSESKPDVPTESVTHSTSDIITELSNKMTAFSNHMLVYMCALGLSAEQIIADTGISYFREIRDKSTVMSLFEYITISTYFIKKYKACPNPDVKDTFAQIAGVFNDIYVTTLYFNDCVK